MKPSADWIKSKGRKNLRTYCERCGDSFTARLPMRLECFAALVTAFVRTHRKCRAKE